MTTVPIQVSTSASQVSFTNSGPVLNLGITLAIPVNELIEALLAYQDHYAKATAKAGTTASQPAFGENQHVSLQANVSLAQQGIVSSASAVEAQKKNNIAAKGTPPAQSVPTEVTEMTKHLWNEESAINARKAENQSSRAMLLKNTQEEYAKKGKWATDKGFVPSFHKPEPLKPKEFTLDPNFVNPETTTFSSSSVPKSIGKKAGQPLAPTGQVENWGGGPPTISPPPGFEREPATPPPTIGRIPKNPNHPDGSKKGTNTDSVADSVDPAGNNSPLGVQDMEGMDGDGTEKDCKQQ